MASAVDSRLPTPALGGRYGKPPTHSYQRLQQLLHHVLGQRWEFFSLGLLFELHVLYALATAYYFARRDPYKSYVFNSLVEMTLQFSCLRAQEVHINEHFVDLHLKTRRRLT